MALTPDRTLVLAFDSSSNNVEVINSVRQSQEGNIQLPGPTTSMVALETGSALCGSAHRSNEQWAFAGRD